MLAHDFVDKIQGEHKVLALSFIAHRINKVEQSFFGIPQVRDKKFLLICIY